MEPLQNRALPQFTLNWSANQAVFDELERGNLLRGLLFRLQGQLTVATPASNNQPGDILAGDALALINRLRIRLNSSEVIRDLSPRGIIVQSHFLSGVYPRDRLGQLGDSTTANPAFDICFVVPFQLPRRRYAMPLATVLDTRAGRISKAEVEVQWAASAAACNPNATGFQVNPSLEVYAIQSYNADPSKSYGFIRQYEQISQLSATNPRFLVDLATAHTYLGMVLNATDAAVDDIAVINNIRLQTGGVIFEDWDPRVLEDGFGRQLMGRDGVQDEFFVSTQYDPRAYYPIERPYDGVLSELLPASRLAQLNLELDTTIGGGATLINTFVFQYVQPPQRG